MSNNEFYTVVTMHGAIAEADAHAKNTSVLLTQIGIGDVDYEPSGSEVSLKNELFRVSLNALYQDPKNPHWLVAEAIVPGDIGGFWIREVGIFTEDGTLYAIAKYPATYKPTFEAGASKTLYIRMIFEVSNSANVTLLVDESVVTATKNDMLNLQKLIEELKGKVKSASDKEPGMVQLSSAVDSESEKAAATSLAVKKAYDLAKTANNKGITVPAAGEIGSIVLGMGPSKYMTYGYTISGAEIKSTFSFKYTPSNGDLSITSMGIVLSGTWMALSGVNIVGGYTYGLTIYQRIA